MQHDLVSIIIPTYNRAHCLGRAIEGVLAQSHKNYEIIIVDDGSVDGTRQMICDRYSGESRVRYVYQSNGGVTAARNRGLGLARGDYIALLDSDDFWFPWKLEVQLKCLRQFPEAGMIWSDMQAIDPEGHVIEGAFLKKMYDAYRHFEMSELFSSSIDLATWYPNLPKIAFGRLWVGNIFPQILMGNLVHTSTVLLTRDRFEKVKAFSNRFKISGEDYDFHLRTCEHGPVALIDKPTIQYQTGAADQLTRPEYRLETAVNALLTVLPYFRKGTPPGLSRSLARRRLAELHAWVGDGMLDAGRRREAASHLVRSLFYKPSSLRTYKLMTATAIPNKLLVLARWGLSRFRGKDLHIPNLT